MSTNNNFKELRTRLEEEKVRVSKELEQSKSSGPTTGERREGSPFGKREEEATEAQELEQRLAVEQKLSQQLTAVDHALDKFDKGTYGLCDNCGQPIEPARLEALPLASLCIKCKAEKVKNGKT